MLTASNTTSLSEQSMIPIQKYTKQIGLMDQVYATQNLLFEWRVSQLKMVENKLFNLNSTRLESKTFFVFEWCAPQKIDSISRVHSTLKLNTTWNARCMTIFSHFRSSIAMMVNAGLSSHDSTLCDHGSIVLVLSCW